MYFLTRDLKIVIIGTAFVYIDVHVHEFYFVISLIFFFFGNNSFNNDCSNQLKF